MYLGRIVELAEYKDLFRSPIYPYTQALLSAIPLAKLDVKREHIILEGDVSSPIEPPNNCRFAARCRYAKDICMSTPPALREVLQGHFTACHFANEV